MLNILTGEQLQQALEHGSLPSGFLDYLAAEYEGMRQALHHEDSSAFSLADHGYCMIVLEPGDGLGSSAGGLRLQELLASHPEYVERVPLPDGTSTFRACFLFDNECLSMLYAAAGTLEPCLEKALTERFTGNEYT